MARFFLLGIIKGRQGNLMSDAFYVVMSTASRTRYLGSNSFDNGAMAGLKSFLLFDEGVTP